MVDTLKPFENLVILVGGYQDVYANICQDMPSIYTILLLIGYLQWLSNIYQPLSHTTPMRLLLPLHKLLLGISEMAGSVGADGSASQDLDGSVGALAGGSASEDPAA